MSKRIFVFTACLMSIILMVTGCKTDSQSNMSGTDEIITISVGNIPKETAPEKRKVYEDLVVEMRNLYPNIVVKLDEYTYDVTTFLPKAASGQLPNLYVTHFTETGKIIEAGYAKDITKEMKEHKYDVGLVPDLLNLVTKDNKYYGIPYWGYLIGMWYNVSMFEQAGLLDENGVPIAPRTYDELALTARTIKEKTGKAGFFLPTIGTEGGWQFMNIAWSFGANFMEKVDGRWKAVFNSPEAIAALQYVKDLKWKYNVLPENSLVGRNDLFKLISTDQVAMAYYAENMEESAITNYNMSKDNIAVSAVPAGPGGRYSQIGGSVYMVSTDTTDAQVDAIFKWLALKGDCPEMTDKARESIQAKIESNIAANKVVVPPTFGVWANKQRVEEEQTMYKEKMNVNPLFWPSLYTGLDVTLRAEEPVNAQQLYLVLTAAIQSVLTNQDADPKQELDKAVESFQKDFLDPENIMERLNENHARNNFNTKNT